MNNLTIIAAMDYARGIGIRNQLPWHLPEDLQHFKRRTIGHPIIMGRKTFESIGRALPNRLNIVVTRNLEWKHPNVAVFNSLESVMKFIQDAKAFVIGGAEVYAQALPIADHMILTRIYKQFKCDTYFPNFSAEEWEEKSRQMHTSVENQFDYAYVTYAKRR